MKKLTTTMMQQTLNKQDQCLTVGLDLGDRSSFYCVLDEAGDILMEQRLSTTPKAIQEIFGAMPRSRIALETGTHSPWVRLSTKGPSRLQSAPMSVISVEFCPLPSWRQTLPRQFSTGGSQRLCLLMGFAP